MHQFCCIVLLAIYGLWNCRVVHFHFHNLHSDTQDDESYSQPTINYPLYF